MLGAGVSLVPAVGMFALLMVVMMDTIKANTVNSRYFAKPPMNQEVKASRMYRAGSTTACKKAPAVASCCAVTVGSFLLLLAVSTKEAGLLVDCDVP